MNFTPQVETAEISDAALDQVSGGQAGSASAGLTGALAGTVNAVACVDVFAAASPEGVALGLHTHAQAQATAV
ncbi:hypothetical protein [Streptomyces sp. NPDC056628]|uniref:hypothetical protein n=1 Tax=Streptomyces sp. NPDC056628 TaxID=3345882 RepID=UPI0036A2694D